MQKILVIGGAGFIGSHMVQILNASGYYPMVLDNLSTGHADAVTGAPLIRGNLGDELLLDQLFSQHNFAAVMHFAAFSQVAESMRLPLDYYVNNVAATITLLKSMRKHSVKRFIFSSTAAVYGHPDVALISERAPTSPINPYGRGKLIVETILREAAETGDFRYMALRYFNAAGADPAGQLGERHEPETHLIPIILQAAAGRRSEVQIFGHDYGTPDGTCVRDYVHVTDICQAHELALQRLLDGGNSDVYNLGNGLGFSVQQVIDTACRVTNIDIPYHYSPRRDGDPAKLVADSRKARRELGWKPQFSQLQTMISHAWGWEQRHHYPTRIPALQPVMQLKQRIV